MTQYIFLKLYTCILSNTSAIWSQAAHTTYQLSSPSCSTRAKRKNLTVNKKIFESFLVKGPLAEELQDKNSKRTKQKKTRARKAGTTDSPEILDRGEKIIPPPDGRWGEGSGEGGVSCSQYLPMQKHCQI